MIFTYNKEELNTLDRTESFRWILGNGLGGYAATTAAFSVNRCDDGLLCGAVRVPNRRRMLVHRLKEQLVVDGRVLDVSSQKLADGTAENGFRYLERFTMDAVPEWEYRFGGIRLGRRCAMVYGSNASVVCYELTNDGETDAELTVSPGFLFTDKGQIREKGKNVSSDLQAELLLSESENAVSYVRVAQDDRRCAPECQADSSAALSQKDGAGCCGTAVLLETDGEAELCTPWDEELLYEEDARDGRPGSGAAVHCCRIRWKLPAGSCRRGYLLFRMEPRNPLEVYSPGETGISTGKGTISVDISARKEQSGGQRAGYPFLKEQSGGHKDGFQLLEEQILRRESLLGRGSFRSPEAQELCRAADLYLTGKEIDGASVSSSSSARKLTAAGSIIAGYPLFGDWGRDTMIALPGCILAAGLRERTREILRTFLRYERHGLVPNLFPEDGEEPMYNTVDGALLIFESLWQYLQTTEDYGFAEEAWPVLVRILKAYMYGTDHGIRMDEDGLIRAGEGLDQVTWMDVCIDGVLPTPRHGKPVEINAYWYNALRIMERLAERLRHPETGELCGKLAGKVKESFLREFILPEGYLKDVISGTGADRQLRCNQIWALTLSFTMLPEEQEMRILEILRRHLYTPRGLRTLSPEDPQYRGHYGGSQFERDMAYHQGTVWVFPMGAWYLALLKHSRKHTELREEVRRGLSAVGEMLREGCVGQLPEIYDGDNPSEGKGCYAQAWSVGEMLRVYREWERTETCVPTTEGSCPG